MNSRLEVFVTRKGMIKFFSLEVGIQTCSSMISDKEAFYRNGMECLLLKVTQSTAMGLMWLSEV